MGYTEFRIGDDGELYSYIFKVKDSTEKIINSLSYDELKKKIAEERKEYLKSLKGNAQIIFV